MSREIAIRRRRGILSGDFAILDDVDYERLEVYKWYKNCSNYVYRMLPNDGGAYFMHWDVMGSKPPRGKVYDHLNGNPLDNRTENLEFITHAENCRRGNLNSKLGRKHIPCLQADH